MKRFYCFKDALIGRFNIAMPTQQSITNFITAHCPDSLSTGMAKLIRILQENNVDCLGLGLRLMLATMLLILGDANDIHANCHC